MDTTDIFDLIVRCTREVVPELESHAFQRSDRLEALGANSMDRAEIVTMVLESLSLKIPRVELFGPNNIGELADLLHEKTR
jgi:polyketide biosynthesis acyl carrier protein